MARGRRSGGKKTVSTTSFGDARNGRKVTRTTQGRRTTTVTQDRREGPGGVVQVDTTTQTSGDPPDLNLGGAEQFVTLLFLLGCIGVYLHYRPQVTAWWQRIVDAKPAPAPGTATPGTGPGGIPTPPSIPKVPTLTP